MGIILTCVTELFCFFFLLFINSFQKSSKEPISLFITNCKSVSRNHGYCYTSRHTHQESRSIATADQRSQTGETSCHRLLRILVQALQRNRGRDRSAFDNGSFQRRQQNPVF